jgi:hypothetical protein
MIGRGQGRFSKAMVTAFPGAAGIFLRTIGHGNRGYLFSGSLLSAEWFDGKIVSPYKDKPAASGSFTHRCSPERTQEQTTTVIKTKTTPGEVNV